MSEKGSRNNSERRAGRMYCIAGNPHDLFCAFDREELTHILHKSAEEYLAQLHLDLPRTHFLRVSDVFDVHERLFLYGENPGAHYMQGDMTASNLQLIFGDLPLFDNVNYDNYEKNIVHSSFAFIDRNGNPAGLTFCYLKNQPDKWIVTLVKNTHLSQKEATAFMLSSALPERSPRNNLQFQQLDNSLLTCFINEVNSLFVEKILRQAINKDGTICSDINLLCNLFSGKHTAATPLDTSTRWMNLLLSRSDRILANPILLHLNQYRCRFNLTYEELMLCLDPYSRLANSLTHIIDTDNSPHNKEANLRLAIALWRLKKEAYLVAWSELLDPADKHALLTTTEHKEQSANETIHLLQQTCGPYFTKVIHANYAGDLSHKHNSATKLATRRIFSLLLTLDNESRELCSLLILKKPVNRFYNQAHQFVRALNEIEQTCNATERYLKKEAPEKYEQYMELQLAYRQRLYAIVYATIIADKKPTKNAFLADIEEASKEMLAAVDVHRNPKLSLFFDTLLNILCLVLLGTPCIYNKYQTGQFFLHIYTDSGQQLRTMHDSVAQKCLNG